MYKPMTATLYWDKMEADVTDLIKIAQSDKYSRKSKKKYGQLSPKEVTMIPCESVCIYRISLCTVTGRLSNDRMLNVMTFVDPATG